MSAYSQVVKYAAAVRSGELPSCLMVRKAVERWYADLERDDLYFDKHAFLQVVRFPGIRYIFYVGLKKKTIEAHVAFPRTGQPGWRKSNKVWLQESECYLHNLQHAMRLVGVEINISPYFCDE